MTAFDSINRIPEHAYQPARQPGRDGSAWWAASAPRQMIFQEENINNVRISPGKQKKNLANGFI